MQRVSRLRVRPKGNENRRSLRSLFGNVWRRYFWGVIYGFVFCCKGRNISYAFVIYNKYYTQSVRIWQAINRFAKKTNILRYLIKFVMIFPQKT